MLFILTLGAAYSGYVDPHISSIPAVLVLILPYLAIATAVTAALWLCFKAWFTAALGFLVLIISAAPLEPVFPLSSSSKEKHGQRTFTLITYNISHAEDLKNPQATNNRTIRWIIEQDADIVVLQELFRLDSKEIPNFSESLRDSLLRAYPYWGGDASSDRLILSKFDVTTRYDILDTYNITRKGFDIFTVNIYGHHLNIIDTHLTSFDLNHDERRVFSDIAGIKESKQGMNMLKSSVREKLSAAFRHRAETASDLRDLINITPDPLIVCGDFNDVPSSRAYRIIRGEDLRDAYAETGFGHLITFNSHLFYFHIDQILYRGNLQALSVEKGNIDSSDHYPLIARFAFTAPPGSSRL